MLVEHDICGASRIIDSADLDNFINNNKEKIITRLNWSPNELEIIQQIQFAIKNKASFVISEIFLEELPNSLLSEEISFISKTCKFIKPIDYKHNLKRNISKSDKILFLIFINEIDNIFGKDKYLSKILELKEVKNQIEIIYIKGDNLEIENIVYEINSYKKIVLLTEYPQFIDFVLCNILDFDNTILKTPYYSPRISRPLLSRYNFRNLDLSKSSSIRSRLQSLFDDQNDVFIKPLVDNNQSELDETKRLRVLQTIHKHECEESIWSNYTSKNLSNDSLYELTRSEKKLFYSILTINRPKYIEQTFWNSYQETTVRIFVQILINKSKTYQGDQEFRFIIKKYLSKYDLSNSIIELLNVLSKNNQNLTFLTLEKFLCHSEESQFENFKDYSISLFNSINISSNDEFYLAKKLFFYDSIKLENDQELKNAFKDEGKLNQLQTFIRMLPVFHSTKFIIGLLKNYNLNKILQNTLLNGFFYSKNISEPHLLYGFNIDPSINNNTISDLYNLIDTLNLKTHLSLMIKISARSKIDDIKSYDYPNNHYKILVLYNLLNNNLHDQAKELLDDININSLNNNEFLMLCFAQIFFQPAFKILKLPDKQHLIEIADKISNVDYNHTGIHTYLYKYFSNIDRKKSEKYLRIAQSSEFNHRDIHNFLSNF